MVGINNIMFCYTFVILPLYISGVFSFTYTLPPISKLSKYSNDELKIFWFGYSCPGEIGASFANTINPFNVHGNEVLLLYRMYCMNSELKNFTERVSKTFQNQSSQNAEIFKSLISYKRQLEHFSLDRRKNFSPQALNDVKTRLDSLAGIFDRFRKDFEIKVERLITFSDDLKTQIDRNPKSLLSDDVAPTFGCNFSALYPYLKNISEAIDFEFLVDHLRVYDQNIIEIFRSVAGNVSVLVSDDEKFFSKISKEFVHFRSSYDNYSSVLHSDFGDLIFTIERLFNYTPIYNRTSDDVTYGGFFGNIVSDLLSGLKAITEDVVKIVVGVVRPVLEVLIKFSFQQFIDTIPIIFSACIKFINDLLPDTERVLNLVSNLLEQLFKLLWGLILYMEERYYIFEYACVYIFFRSYSGSTSVTLIILTISIGIFGLKRDPLRKSIYLTIISSSNNNNNYQLVRSEF